tara:strand:+ start:273 stop:533 length:261 start_codon:yes stop_codon:yes gene_type:complete
MNKRAICAIFLVSEKSRKNEELKTVSRVTNNINIKNILKKVFFIISEKNCLFSKITMIRNKQIIHILTKAFAYVINGIERQIKKPI